MSSLFVLLLSPTFYPVIHKLRLISLSIHPCCIDFCGFSNPHPFLAPGVFPTTSLVHFSHIIKLFKIDINFDKPFSTTQRWNAEKVSFSNPHFREPAGGALMSSSASVATTPKEDVATSPKRGALRRKKGRNQTAGSQPGGGAVLPYEPGAKVNLRRIGPKSQGGCALALWLADH